MRSSYPLLGGALVFLGALSFGGLLALIAQIFHTDGEPYKLLWIWSAFASALAYVTHSRAIAMLGLGLALAGYLNFLWVAASNVAMACAILTLPLVVYAIGRMHDLLPAAYKSWAQLYARAGLLLGVFVYCLFSFHDLTAEFSLELATATAADRNVALLTAALAALAVAVYYLRSTDDRPRVRWNTAAGIALALPTVVVFLPNDGGVVLRTTVAANLLLFGMLLAMLYCGYARRDSWIVNVAALTLFVYLLAKYIDWFHDIFAPEIFWLVGGLLVICVAWYGERQRSALITRFGDEGQ